MAVTMTPSRRTVRPALLAVRPSSVRHSLDPEPFSSGNVDGITGCDAVLVNGDATELS
jgi:hypothetical protein